MSHLLDEQLSTRYSGCARRIAPNNFTARRPLLLARSFALRVSRRVECFAVEFFGQLFIDLTVGYLARRRAVYHFRPHCANIQELGKIVLLNLDSLLRAIGQVGISLGKIYAWAFLSRARSLLFILIL